MSIRLLVDAHVFDKGFEGTRTFIKGIYSEIANAGDIELFVAAHNIENLKNEFPTTKNIVFIKYKTSSGFLRLAFEIPFIIRKYKIDYAHFQYVAPWIHNCKFIVTTHDLLFKEYPEAFSLGYRVARNYMFKRSAAKADILTTVSEYSKQSIQRHLGIDGRMISVIKNGIVNIFFENIDKKFSKNYLSKKYGMRNYLLYVSRIEPRKNHALIVKAFVELQLARQNYQLVFIGRQSLRTRELNEALSSLPEEVKHCLLILDKIDDDDLVHFYNGAELFLYPSMAEGFGIPPLEAGALKTPVVCSHATAMSDFNFFEEQFDPSDYESFKAKLKNVLGRKPCEQKLTQISETIKEKYCWKKSAQQLCELINSTGV